MVLYARETEARRFFGGVSLNGRLELVTYSKTSRAEAWAGIGMGGCAGHQPDRRTRTGSQIGTRREGGHGNFELVNNTFFSFFEMSLYVSRILTEKQLFGIFSSV